MKNKIFLDAQLLFDAKRCATGANIHTANVLIAYYINEIEIYNVTNAARTLDCIQELEFGLRKFVNKCKKERSVNDSK